MGRARTIARRTFLVGSAAVLGGVAFGTWAYRRDVANPLLDTIEPGQATLNPYVLIDADGVTLITPRADVGQGAASIQAHLLAEELDVDPHAVRTDPGPASNAYYNGRIVGEGMPLAAWETGFVARRKDDASDVLGKLVGLNITGGSTTVPDGYDRLRAAGASARETLKQAAANRLGVDRATLTTKDGTVIAPDGTTLSYADLAQDAAALDPVDAPLRDPSEWRRLGLPMRRTDIVAKSTGTFRYGTDIDMPGLVHATVITAPVRGAGVASFDATAARAMRGVEDVLPVTDGLAVIADNTWRAMNAARALVVEWGDAGTANTDAAMWQAHEDAIDGEEHDSRFADDGDVGAAPGTRLSAEYRAPFLHHAPMEPANATILHTPERTDVWTATQVPTFARDAVAAIVGQEPDRVTLHNLPSGGSFGHRLEDEWIRQTAEIAVQLPGRPVRMTWTREQDMRHGFLRPMALARGTGTVEDGRVRSLDLAVAGQSVSESQLGRLGYPPVGPDVTLVAGAWDAPYAIPDRRVTGHRVPAGVAVSSWRSVGASLNGFFFESLLSELIHEAGADPVAERLRLIHHAPSRAVLEAVADMASWDGPAPAPGTGRGVAFTYAFGVPCAQIVEVVDTDAGIRIDRLWLAAEVGRVLDPVNIEAQLSGAALFGLGHAMQAEITHPDGAPVQSNFHDYPSLRLWQTPRVEVRAMGTTGAIRGAGEPGLPAAAPALADAIFAATGTRPREMPFARSVRFA